MSQRGYEGLEFLWVVRQKVLTFAPLHREVEQR